MGDEAMPAAFNAAVSASEFETDEITATIETVGWRQESSNIVHLSVEYDGFLTEDRISTLRSRGLEVSSIWPHDSDSVVVMFYYYADRAAV